MTGLQNNSFFKERSSKIITSMCHSLKNQKWHRHLHPDEIDGA